MCPQINADKRRWVIANPMQRLSFVPMLRRCVDPEQKYPRLSAFICGHNAFCSHTPLP